jgi:hypothetical protein
VQFLPQYADTLKANGEICGGAGIESIAAADEIGGGVPLSTRHR